MSDHQKTHFHYVIKIFQNNSYFKLKYYLVDEHEHIQGVSCQQSIASSVFQLHPDFKHLGQYMTHFRNVAHYLF